MLEDAFQALVDDRPMFTLTVSWAEALTVKDALTCASMICEGDMEGVAAYVLAHDSAPETAYRDSVSDRLDEQMAPARAQLAREIKLMRDENAERLLREIDEMDDLDL